MQAVQRKTGGNGFADKPSPRTSKYGTMYVFFKLGLDIYVTFLFPLCLSLHSLPFHLSTFLTFFGVTLSCFPNHTGTLTDT